MRRIESLHYLLGLGHFVLFFTCMYIDTLSLRLVCLIAMFPIVHYFEGTRLIQLPFILGLLLHSLVVVFLNDPWRLYLSIPSFVLLCVSPLLSFHLGSSDLSCVPLGDAPYLVGHRDLRTLTLG